MPALRLRVVGNERPAEKGCCSDASKVSSAQLGFGWCSEGTAWGSVHLYRFRGRKKGLTTTISAYKLSDETFFFLSRNDKFIHLFIYGCVGSSFLCEGFL